MANDFLTLDAPREVARIAEAIHQQVTRTLKRRGVVLGLSGGIDSSVTAALCVRALGSDRVLGLLMPEADSAPESLDLGRQLAAALGARTIIEDVTAILDAAGCYARRDEAIRKIVPEYGAGYRSKIVLSSAPDEPRYRLFVLVVQSPDGGVTRVRLNADTYLQIVAATSFKQRARKMVEYYYADRDRLAVAGTANRLEIDQGFYVKNGDGAADLKPIAHLYKSQVYQLAEALGIPETIRRRTPTTDTYSLEQTQEEFYFSIPYQALDACLYGLSNGLSSTEVAPYAGLTPAQVDQVYDDIAAKRRAAQYLEASGLVIPEAAPVTFPFSRVHHTS